jgi:hypothetical protein
MKLELDHSTVTCTRIWLWTEPPLPLPVCPMCGRDYDTPFCPDPWHGEPPA